MNDVSRSGSIKVEWADMSLVFASLGLRPSVGLVRAYGIFASDRRAVIDDDSRIRVASVFVN